MQVRAVHEVHAPVGLERPHVQVAPQLADRVDPDHLAERVELVEIRVELARRAEERVAERARDLPLAHARRAVEEVRVRRPLASAASSSRVASACSEKLANVLTNLLGDLVGRPRAVERDDPRRGHGRQRAVGGVDAAHEVLSLALDAVGIAAAAAQRLLRIEQHEEGAVRAAGRA